MARSRLSVRGGSGSKSFRPVFEQNVSQRSADGRPPVGVLRPAPVFPARSGIADETDVLRPAYLLEHLIAVGAARAEGIPVAGCAFAHSRQEVNRSRCT